MENGGSELNDRLRRFDEQEKQRVKHAMAEHEEKSKRRLRSLREKSLATIKELEQIQVVCLTHRLMLTVLFRMKSEKLYSKVSRKNWLNTRKSIRECSAIGNRS